MKYNIYGKRNILGPLWLLTLEMTHYNIYYICDNYFLDCFL